MTDAELALKKQLAEKDVSLAQQMADLLEKEQENRTLRAELEKQNRGRTKEKPSKPTKKSSTSRNSRKRSSSRKRSASRTKKKSTSRHSNRRSKTRFSSPLETGPTENIKKKPSPVLEDSKAETSSRKTETKKPKSKPKGGKLLEGLTIPGVQFNNAVGINFLMVLKITGDRIRDGEPREKARYFHNWHLNSTISEEDRNKDAETLKRYHASIKDKELLIYLVRTYSDPDVCQKTLDAIAPLCKRENSCFERKDSKIHKETVKESGVHIVLEKYLDLAVTISEEMEKRLQLYPIPPQTLGKAKEKKQTTNTETPKDAPNTSLVPPAPLMSSSLPINTTLTPPPVPPPRTPAAKPIPTSPEPIVTTEIKTNSHTAVLIACLKGYAPRYPDIRFDDLWQSMGKKAMSLYKDNPDKKQTEEEVKKALKKAYQSQTKDGGCLKLVTKHSTKNDIISHTYRFVEPKAS